MKIVPGNRELLLEYYGTEFGPSMRVYFLLNDDGKPIGAAGFIRRKGGDMVIFSEGKEEAFADKRAVVRFANAMMDVADANGWTLIATKDGMVETSHGFLTHLGFVIDDEDEEVYVRCPV